MRMTAARHPLHPQHRPTPARSRRWQAQAWDRILGDPAATWSQRELAQPLPPDPRPAVSARAIGTEAAPEPVIKPRSGAAEEVVARRCKVDDGIIELITDYQALSQVDRDAVRKLARALARPKHLRTR
jgi:hypothetical protein